MEPIYYRAQGLGHVSMGPAAGLFTQFPKLPVHVGAELREPTVHVRAESFPPPVRGLDPFTESPEIALHLFELRLNTREAGGNV
jgi:hypothetical protein